MPAEGAPLREPARRAADGRNVYGAPVGRDMQTKACPREASVPSASKLPAEYDAFGHTNSVSQHDGLNVRRFESAANLFIDEAPPIELQTASDLFDDGEDDAASFSKAMAPTSSESTEASCSEGSNGRAEDIGGRMPVESGPPFGWSAAAWADQDTRCFGPPLAARRHMETRTTVMLQRLPYHLTEWDMCRELDALGFASKYDAVAVPRNQKRGQNLGYAFVNFVDPSFAAACIEACRGLPFAGARPDKICFAEYSKNQGSTFIYDCLRATASKQRASVLGRRAPNRH